MELNAGDMFIPQKHTSFSSSIWGFNWLSSANVLVKAMSMATVVLW
jgi:hypothetical protein